MTKVKSQRNEKVEWKQVLCWVKSKITKELWRFPTHEFQDLVQESWIVFDRVVRTYPDDSAKSLVGKFRISVVNRFHRIADKQRVAQCEESFITGRRAENRDYDSGNGGLFEYEPPESYIVWREVELRHDIEAAAPGIRRILEHSNWHEGVNKRRACLNLWGKPEKKEDLLRRLARVPKKSKRYDICAELQLLTG